MSTGFGGGSTPHRRGECAEQLALSEFPDWGIEIMSGLYGPATIRAACGDRRRRRAVAEPAGDPCEVPSCVGDAAPLLLQVQAVTELSRMIERGFRRLVMRLQSSQRV